MQSENFCKSQNFCVSDENYDLDNLIKDLKLREKDL